MSSVAKKVSDFFSPYPKRTYEKGEILILPKTIVSSIYYIEEGVIRAYLISSKGNEVTINFFGKKAFIPISLVMNKIECPYYYEAFTNLTVRIAPVKKVLNFLQNNSLVMYDLLQRVYKGTEGILLHKEFLVEGNSEAKLAYALVILGRRFGELQENKTIYISLDLDEIRIASIAGLARETVSRELRKFQEKSIIDYKKRRITINDMSFLETIIQAL